VTKNYAKFVKGFSNTSFFMSKFYTTLALGALCGAAVGLIAYNIADVPSNADTASDQEDSNSGKLPSAVTAVLHALSPLGDRILAHALESAQDFIDRLHDAAVGDPDPASTAPAAAAASTAPTADSPAE